MKFPNLVYKCPGPHQRKGGTYDYRQVIDENSLSDALSNGWFKTLDEAIEGKKKGDPAEVVAETIGESVEPVSEDAPPTRTELEQMADELNVKYDSRTSDARLLQKINQSIPDE